MHVRPAPQPAQHRAQAGDDGVGGPGDLPIEGLETLPYGRDRLVLVTPRAHALAARRSVDFVDSLPRTPSGKVLKRVLREPYWAGQARHVAGS